MPRFGLVGQRPLIYRRDREIRRDGFGQLMSGKATPGLYVFNPGDDTDRLAVVSFGVQCQCGES